jgi:ElaB/YqjD/DUF883 family membrane-anchored ribosome-binding protein
MNPISSTSSIANQGAEQAIRATQRVAHDTVDQLAEHADAARARAVPVINRVAGEAEQLARRGIDALRDGSDQMRAKVLRTSDHTIAYIKDEPVRSVLIAAAAGAALTLLASLLSRSRH